MNEKLNIPQNNTYKECELEWVPLRLIRKYLLPQNLIIKLLQYFIIKSQLHFSIL